MSFRVWASRTGSGLPEPAIGEAVVQASRRGWRPADPELSRR
jgi:hypothetical protein